MNSCLSSGGREGSAIKSPLGLPCTWHAIRRFPSLRASLSVLQWLQKRSAERTDSHRLPALFGLELCATWHHGDIILGLVEFWPTILGIYDIAFTARLPDAHMRRSSLVGIDGRNVAVTADGTGLPPTPMETQASKPTAMMRHAHFIRLDRVAGVLTRPHPVRVMETVCRGVPFCSGTGRLEATPNARITIEFRPLPDQPDRLVVRQLTSC